MNILVTGGAGFIGRWVVKGLLEKDHKVYVLDDLSNGSIENIKEFENNSNLVFVKGDIKNLSDIKSIFRNKIELCFHLGASINVQESIDEPEKTFNNDVVGTFNVLEICKKHKIKIVFMSTCMVYQMAENITGISENSPTLPASPYAGSKISGENLALSYYYAYGLPVVILRPFNTYGPYQKASGEGGVVSIFINQSIKGDKLKIYGDGTQTRDLLYVEDCAEFVIRAGFSNAADGEIINAGTGKDVTINELAEIIDKNKDNIIHVPHIHPQSEIKKLLCNNKKAEDILNWKPEITLEEGILLTKKWIYDTNS